MDARKSSHAPKLESDSTPAAAQKLVVKRDTSRVLRVKSGLRTAGGNITVPTAPA